MSKRKYSFKKPTPENLSSLAERFPKAVRTITVHKLNYAVVAKLLDCGVPLPEIELADSEDQAPPLLKKADRL